LDTANITVLIVDDDEKITKTFARILQRKGFNTDTAQTGTEAIEKTRTNHYAATIIDAEIPDSTLILQKLAKSKTIKIVITDFPEEAILKGADACLTKVVKPKELLFLIEKMLKEKQTTNH
jgi:DNA-binding response OmpR family regulator